MKMQYPLFSRTIPSNTGDAEALCIYLNSINIGQLAVMYVNDDYGTFFFKDIATAASNHAIDIYGVSFNQGQLRSSLEKAIQQLQSSPFRYVFCVIPRELMKIVAPALHEANLLGNPNYAFFFSDSFDPTVLVEVYEGVLDEKLAHALNQTAMIALKPPEEQLEKHSRILTSVQNDRDMWAYFRTRHEYTFRSDFPLVPSMFSTLTYDAVMALGLSACKKSDHHLLGDPVLTGPALHDQLRRLRFKGASGWVSFNETTGTRSTCDMAYQISNVVTFADPNRDSYGVYSVPRVEIRACEQTIKTHSGLTFASGSTQPPAALGPAETVHLSPSTAVVVITLILAASVFAFSTYCAVWTLVNRKHPAIQSSLPVFLVLLSLGSMLVAAAMVLGTWHESVPLLVRDIGCAASTWFLAVGFTILFGSLFAKTWRIKRIYANAIRFRRVEIRAKDVLWPLIALLGIDIAVLSARQAVVGLGYSTQVLAWDKYERPLIITGGCFLTSHTSDEEWIFITLLSTINFAALVLSTVESYRARNLPSRFNESFYIAVSNLILLESFVIGLPTLFVTSNDPTMFILIRGLLETAICFGVLLPIFLTKFGKREETPSRRFVASAAAPSGPSVATSSIVRSRSFFVNRLSRSPLSLTRAATDRRCLHSGTAALRVPASSSNQAMV